MNARIADMEIFEADKLRLEKEIDRFREGTATRYNTDLEISSIEKDTGVKMEMFFSKVTLLVNGELGPRVLADFFNRINNGFDYRGDPGYNTYDPLGVIGFAEGVRQQIRDMNILIIKEAK